jgi:DNA-directed RNA polymerase specialized sigma24 family protein
MANENRIERLLAMLLVTSMRGDSQKDKALALSRAGFAPTEIAELLGTSSASVSQQLYEARQGTKKNLRSKHRTDTS